MKELQEIVNENKKGNKYLDDISDIDCLSNNASAIATQTKLKPNSKPENGGHQSVPGGIINQENQNNIDIYNYCDEMMKEISQLEHRKSTKQSTSEMSAFIPS
jgi:hypothetical protein